MRVSKNKVRWTGELKRPIRVRVNRPQGLAITDPETVTRANEEMIRLANEAIGERILEKLRLLMEHYSIPDKDDWFSLALALATDHVPGFQSEWPLIQLPVDWEGNPPVAFRGRLRSIEKRLAVTRSGILIDWSDCLSLSNKKKHSTGSEQIVKQYPASQRAANGRRQQTTGVSFKTGSRP